jgi:hypothetical protein
MKQNYVTQLEQVASPMRRLNSKTGFRTLLKVASTATPFASGRIE